MLYQLLKPIVTTAVHLFYKRIEIVNREFLDEKGPTLIVSNHNNAFLDAVVVEMFAKPQIYSIARGDVFNKRFISPFLTALRILPIFRKEEGVGQMHKNEATFEKCIELLGEKQHIIMYPEGDCVMEKRLRKLRKGAARIVLRAEAQGNFNLKLKVLPVGLNYSSAKKFRSKLFINVGKPFYINQYETLYKEDKVRAVNKLTQQIEDEMRALIVNIEHRADEHFLENVLKLYKPLLMKELGLSDSLKQEHKVNCATADAISYFNKHHHTQSEIIKHHLHDYYQTLSKLHLSEHFFNQQAIGNLNMFSMAKSLFVAGIGMPLHAIGLFFNYLPYRFAYRTADKKVKQVHFHASVNFSIGMFGWIAYYLFQLSVIALLSKSAWLVLVFALLIPATGWYSLNFYSFLKKTYAKWNLFSFVQNDKPLSQLLLKNREELTREMEKAKEIYCKEKKFTKAESTQFSNTTESV